jgi:hypothetical protein
LHVEKELLLLLLRERLLVERRCGTHGVAPKPTSSRPVLEREQEQSTTQHTARLD